MAPKKASREQPTTPARQLNYVGAQKQRHYEELARVLVSTHSNRLALSMMLAVALELVDQGYTHSPSLDNLVGPSGNPVPVGGPDFHPKSFKEN